MYFHNHVLNLGITYCYSQNGTNLYLVGFRHYEVCLRELRFSSNAL